jgi:hypothetical protein
MEASMEPMADGLAGIAAEADAPASDQQAVASIAANGHGRAVAASEEGFDLREMLHALYAVQYGDFSVRLPNHGTGIGS